MSSYKISVDVVTHACTTTIPICEVGSWHDYKKALRAGKLYKLVQTKLYEVLGEKVMDQGPSTAYVVIDGKGKRSSYWLCFNRDIDG